jgi:hypothetical protein
MIKKSFVYFQINCRTYEISKTPAHFVFEDLSMRGYKMPDRKVGLDRQHLKMTLVKLAKWHAATAVLHEKVNKNPCTTKQIHVPNFLQLSLYFFTGPNSYIGSP